MITLKELLLTQDMGDKAAQNICEKVLNDNFNSDDDLVSAIIIKAYIKNVYDKITAGQEAEYEDMADDLSYTINQLTQVKKFIEPLVNPDKWDITSIHPDDVGGYYYKVKLANDPAGVYDDILMTKDEILRRFDINEETFNKLLENEN